MKNLHLIAAGLFTLILGGCMQPQLYTLTVNTEPPGAIVECDGFRLKGSPAKISFVKETLMDSIELQTSDTIMPPSSCIAWWPSGAEARVGLFGGVDVADGTGATATILRPADYPNVETDYSYAERLRKAHNSKTAE